jgi:AAA domain-containing protein/uncharacterized protein DUF6371
VEGAAVNVELLKAAVRRAAPVGYAPTQHWIYHDTSGKGVMAIARYNVIAGDRENRSKQYRPFISDGNGGFIPKFLPDPRPLYNLHKLMANPDAIVVLVEGEKAADAAAELFPEYVVTTSSGGSCQAKNTDLSVLSDRTVYVWPDNNKAGFKYASDVAALVPQARLVSLPDWVPPDWDLANELPEGKTIDDVVVALAAARPSTEQPRLNGVDALRAATRKAVASKTELISRCADDVEPEPISWLWDGRIARGKHTCVAGEPGTGKSQVSLSIIATITTGGQWPCGEGKPQPQKC